VPTAVSSALLQSYAPQEVIVIDDGSEDGGPAHLRARFPEAVAEGRLRILERKHAGVSAARNAGLAAASGAIVAYLDSDNRWEPDHLLYACAALLGTKGATSAYTAIARHNLTDGWSDILFRRYDRAALEQENFIDLNAFVHQRKLIDRLGGFDERLTRLVDWDLVLRLTTGASTAQMPVVTGHHFVERTVLSNLTFTEDAEANLARILANRQGAG
jgi:glycosyltransferase involved in cell wall biosynthesis